MKVAGFAAFMLASIIATSNVASGIFAKSAGEFDDTRVGSGTVGARYIPASEKRTKTRVENGSEKYDYDLFGRQEFEYFPLQLGNGNYKVTIFENVADTRYRVVKTHNLKFDLKDILLVFKASIQTVRWDYDMKAIKKAEELVKDLKTDKEKIKAIHGYLIDALSYDYEKIKRIDSTYVPDIEKVLEEGKGICYDYAALLAGMLRSQNIPAKLKKGYTDLVTGYHAWNEVYLESEKRWIVIDATYDSVVKKSGKAFTMEKPKEKYKASREY